MRLPRSLRSLAMTNIGKLYLVKNVFIIISYCCDYSMATIGEMIEKKWKNLTENRPLVRFLIKSSPYFKQGELRRY